MVKTYWALLAVAGVAVGCSDSEAPRVPAAIEVVLGDGQRGTVGEPLDLPFVVRVIDREGDGYPGVSVDFSVTSGGGALNDKWDSCTLEQGWAGPTPTVSVGAGASSGGYVWMQMTPTAFGATTVQAHLAETALAPVTFTVDVDEPEVTVDIVAPYEEEVIAGPSTEVAAQPFIILVKDEVGAPVPGVSVRWEVTSGSGGDLDHVGPACSWEEPAAGVLINRTGIAREEAVGISSIDFRATAFGMVTVTASVIGSPAAPATFTVEATGVLIVLGEVAPDEWRFIGPEHTPDTDVPVGVAVEWVVYAANARIVSSSTPPGGSSFDSGDLTGVDHFQFVPDVAGTWTFRDEVSGAEGTLSAS